MSLFHGAPLAPGSYDLADGGGFASFDDGNGEVLSHVGTVSVIEWNGIPYGEVDITLPDNTHILRAFMAVVCGIQPPCK